MKLISMTDYILELCKDDNFLPILKDDKGFVKYWSKTFKYAQFLKQPLKLEMFIPCDEDGNVLEEPEAEYCCTSMEMNYNPCGCFGKPINKEYYDYQKAKEKVLFKNIPINEIDINMLKIYDKKNKTIEELFNETAEVDFILTQNAINKLS